MTVATNNTGQDLKRLSLS